jgi:tetratricopeptide (TPR) repeat protein
MAALTPESSAGHPMGGEPNLGAAIAWSATAGAAKNAEPKNPERRRAEPRGAELKDPEPPAPPAAILTLDKATKVEAAAMAAELQIEEQERIRIILFRRRLPRSTLFELLDVDTDTDMRNVKRAYFRLSKEFHPDRHYGKDIGPFEAWLSEVFKAVTDAFKVLGNKKKRAKYEASLRGDAGQHVPQTKEEHAEALFQNACDSELHGDSDQALKLFAAAIRMDEQPRYMRRAAMCAVQARELRVAEEYAKKAADLHGRDASYQRVLADVYRAGAQYDKAKQILERALTLNVENDTLYGELQSDLASVEAAIKEALADS